MSQVQISKTAKRKALIKGIKRSWPFYLMVLPTLVHILIFSYGPMYGLQIAFKDYRTTKGIWGSEWVGLKYFIKFIEFPNFWKYLWNTLRINLISLELFPCSIIFALMLNEVKNAKFKKAVQMITYMPHFLTEVVLCSLVVLFLDGSYGPIGSVLSAIKGTHTNLMGSAAAFPYIYVFSGLWQGLGWGSILYISALAGISSEEVEAARIDGASRLQTVRYVYIPGIMPTIIICLIMNLGSLLGVGYTKVLLLQNDMNLATSTVIGTYTYEIGLLGGQFSYSTAIGLFNNLVNIVLLLATNAICRKFSETSLF